MIISDLTQDGIPVSKLTHGSDKKVLLECDRCGARSWSTYHNYTLSQKRHNRQGKTYCKPCAIKLFVAPKLRGKASPNKGRRMPRGKNASRWGGGIWISSDGYVMIRTESGVIRSSGWAQYRKRCHIVAERKLGRELHKDEHIHHIDLNKLNDDSDNIVVVKRSQHRNIHDSLSKIAAALVQTGLVNFDTTTAEYSLAHNRIDELTRDMSEEKRLRFIALY